MPGKWEKVVVQGIPFITKTVLLEDMKFDVPGVYAIKWADDETYEYVGQSACIRSRLSNHEHGFTNCIFEILEFEDMNQDFYDRIDSESRWIRKLILDGHDLINNCNIAKKARRDLERQSE